MKKKYSVLKRNGQREDWQILLADNFFWRLKGLLGTTGLSERQGLLLTPCNSVHMVGMIYPLDIVYLDRNRNIIKSVEDLKPLIGISWCFSAKDALEIKSGAAKKYGWQIGDHLEFEIQN